MESSQYQVCKHFMLQNFSQMKEKKDKGRCNLCKNVALQNNINYACFGWVKRTISRTFKRKFILDVLKILAREYTKTCICILQRTNLELES